jgi:capsular polysaccharide transport system permease protein
MSTLKLQSWLIDSIQEKLIPLFKRKRTLSIVVIASSLAIIYWGIIASDRYVSEAHIIIQRTDMAKGSGIDIGSILSGSGGSNRADQLLLRDYLLSVDMLIKLDAKLNLRAHYSDWGKDPLSRMWSEQASQEAFHQHFQSRVSVEFDDDSGVLVIKSQGYDPQTAQAITTTLVEEGEHSMNEMARRLAQDQVDFVEKQVAESASRLQQARNAILTYQNQKGIISPQNAAENLAGTINLLESQRSELQTRRGSLLGYLSSQAPSVVELNMQISAIEKQINKEQARLTSPTGKTLSSEIEEFQRLEMTASFAQDIYKTSLVALEQSRVEATRTIKKVSILQNPTLPQYPMQPKRLYNIIIFILVILLLAGITQLLAAIIRDHKD